MLGMRRTLAAREHVVVDLSQVPHDMRARKFVRK